MLSIFGYNEKKFIDVVQNLTIFVESKSENGDLKNIYLKDLVNEGQSQIIYAESGKIVSENGLNFLILNNGSFIDINNNILNLNDPIYILKAIKGKQEIENIISIFNFDEKQKVIAFKIIKSLFKIIIEIAIFKII